MGVRKYTQEEHQFFQEYVPGHSHKEIQQEFIRRFGREITEQKVKGYIANHKLNTGRTGRFEKGHVSHNKGKKGISSPGCEKTWFPKGHIPDNYRPVGSERINVGGYVEVKVADPNKWKLKQRVVWEAAHGPVPKGSCIIFLDGNKQNTDLGNLQMIKRSVLVRMNQKELFFDDPNLTKAGAGLAGVINAMGEAKRRKKNESKTV